MNNQFIIRALGVLIAIGTAFFGSQVWWTEVEAFLIAFESAFTKGSGILPAFKLGTIWFGPIPFGPNPPA